MGIDGKIVGWISLKSAYPEVQRAEGHIFSVSTTAVIYLFTLEDLVGSSTLIFWHIICFS